MESATSLLLLAVGLVEYCFNLEPKIPKVQGYNRSHHGTDVQGEVLLTH